MSFPRYPSYKDSGVEWLGAVPEHWKTSRLKDSLKELYSGGTPESGNSDYWADDEVESIPWVAIGDMTRAPVVATTEKRITPAGLASKRLRVLPAGTLLYSMYASLGKVAVLGLPATINQAILGIVPDPDKADQGFLRYWLNKIESHLELFSSSNTQDNLNAGKIRSFALLVPPLPEQTQIAAFLDRETAKIDALVAEQRRLMELLKEKRQTVISHAVTQGLNPHAPMKPSGIEWLGDVPAHWEVTPIGHLSESLSYGFTNPMPTTDEGPYMLTANDVDYGKVKYDSARRTSFDAFSNDVTEKSRPKKGDVLITKDGTLGRVAIHEGQDACINQSVASLRVKLELLRPEFMSTCLLGGLYQGRMIYDAGGTTIKHIYISRLAKMPIAYPSLAEQDQVMAFLWDEMIKFDTLAAEAQRAIALLQERRTALISAAVTGQIDVRTPT